MLDISSEGSVVDRPNAERIVCAILAVLWEAPRSGSEIPAAIVVERGVRPRMPSLWPTLQLLEDGRFITGRDVDGERVYTIAERGSKRLAEESARLLG